MQEQVGIRGPWCGSTLLPGSSFGVPGCRWLPCTVTLDSWIQFHESAAFEGKHLSVPRHTQSAQGTLSEPRRAPAFERHGAHGSRSHGPAAPGCRAQLPASRRSSAPFGASGAISGWQCIRAGSCLAAETSLLRSDLSTELGRLCAVSTT